MSENPYCSSLPLDRLEKRFERKKPLLDAVQARVEAGRCLFCHDAPCTKACPANINVAKFIWDIHTNNLRGAARAILRKNVFGLSCAMVCPVPDQCEGACVLNHAGQPPVAIAQLQRYATEQLYTTGKPLFTAEGQSEKKVALIGAGPASIACAHDLTVKGHTCTVFERRTMPGGLGTYAMAPYKLNAEETLDEVRWIEQIGFKVKCGMTVGLDVTFASLLEDFDAVFLGVGLGADMSLPVEEHKEEPDGVIGALELIEGIKTSPSAEMKFLENVKDAIIVGGGSTAMDVARELRGLGVRHVSVVYRRDEAEMPIHAHERDAVRKEGSVIRHLVQPVDYLTDATGHVAGVKLVRCELGEPDESGRRRPVMIEGAEELVPAQLVILAIGQEKPKKVLDGLEGLQFSKKGCVIIKNDHGQTDNPKVFAGGDCVNGGMELVHAVTAGREAAVGIHNLLTQKEG